MEPTIRTATLEDDAALAAIDGATWSPATTPSRKPTPGGAFFGPNLAPSDALVAVIDRTVAGYVHVRREIPIEANAHVWALGGLAIAPEHQGRGLAKQLVTAAIDELRSRGAARIRSRVLATNPASLAVHDALGFEVAGVLRGEFVIRGRDVDDVLLTWHAPVPASSRVEPPALTFATLAPDRLEDLIEVMTSCRWDHYVRPVHTRDSVLELWHDGAFGGPDHATFLVEEEQNGAVLGMVRLNDLQDPTPLFDIRIREEARGRGVGAAAVTWLTHHLFERGFASVQGYTRATNAAMRATFERCGYAKEGHMRADDPGGHEHIAYRILKRDVESGTTTPVRWFDL